MFKVNEATPSLHPKSSRFFREAELREKRRHPSLNQTQKKVKRSKGSARVFLVNTSNSQQEMGIHGGGAIIAAQTFSNQAGLGISSKGSLRPSHKSVLCWWQQEDTTCGIKRRDTELSGDTCIHTECTTARLVREHDFFFSRVVVVTHA